ncbi:MAG: PDDEXK nuclease domain-containing protein [Bacteroidota bacterium]
MKSKKQNCVVKKSYSSLIEDIGELLKTGRKQFYSSANTILVYTYWQIGKRIVEFEQGGKKKSVYGSKLLDVLSRDLKSMYGKGFSRTNLIFFRLLYLNYQKSQTLSDQLSWSHYVELLGIEDDLARGFYEKQTLIEKWSVRELRRQINTALFQRLALSKDKKGVLELSKKGKEIKSEEDLVKDPHILEFLKIPQSYKYSEKELEQKTIDNLQLFLLELGKGFSFVARQFRITLDNTHYYVDLVFYNIALKCFVLIDLKTGKSSHLDVGQMNLYLNYFRKEEQFSGDSKPVGIILATEKDNVLVEYALGGISNKLFVSKYQVYLPDKNLLEEKIKSLLTN